MPFQQNPTPHASHSIVYPEIQSSPNLTAQTQQNAAPNNFDLVEKHETEQPSVSDQQKEDQDGVGPKISVRIWLPKQAQVPTYNEKDFLCVLQIHVHVRFDFLWVRFCEGFFLFFDLSDLSSQAQIRNGFL